MSWVKSNWGSDSFQEILIPWWSLLRKRQIRGENVAMLTLKGREFRIRNNTTYTGKGGSSV